jgi:hypothetical protein
MAGSKQHYIPQSLLRGFAVQRDRKTKIEQVWVLPTAREPFCPAINGIAAQHYFYSELSTTGERTLDDAITDYEGRFTSILTDIRSWPVGTDVDSELCGEFISHLVLRNIHLRTGFHRGLSGIIAGAVDWLTNEEKIRDLLGLDSFAPTPRFTERLRSKLLNDPAVSASTFPLDLIEDVGFVLAKENFSKAFAVQMPIIEGAISSMLEDLEQSVRAGHNRILDKLLFQTSMIKSMPITTWIVVETAEKLLLPDCVAISVNSRGEASPLLFCDPKDVEIAMLPVSSARLLVGFRGNSLPESAARFNTYAAECSQQFFIAAERGEEVDLLRTLIGSRSTVAIDGIVQRTLSEVIVGRASVPQTPRTADFVPRATLPNEGVLEFRECDICFFDFGDADFAEEASSGLRGILDELREIWPLDRLDGFTFAENYEQALATVDRGFTPTAILETITAQYGTGAFRTPVVIRDHQIKVRVIGRASIVVDLISAVESERAFSIYRLIRAIANVAYVDLAEHAMPGFWLGRYTDFLEGEKLAAVCSALECYYSCRCAARVLPEILNAQIELLQLTVEAAAVAVQGTVYSHWSSPDFGNVGRSSLFHSGLILDRTAEIIGSLDGLLFRLDSYPQLEALLIKCGLKNWFELLASDLRNWWNEQQEWSGFERLQSLVYHVDRISWGMGIFTWRRPDGEWTVFAPTAPPKG